MNIISVNVSSISESQKARNNVVILLITLLLIITLLRNT